MPRRSSVLLINEPPLQALPSLACLVGINGAIILQQIHYWIQVSEHKIEGYTWIYNSYSAWAKQFKWLKPHAIQWHIRVLEKSGYLIARQFKYKTKNNTKWYRIDYEKLDAAYEGQIDYQKTDSGSQETGSGSQETDSDSQETDGHSAKNGQSLKLNLGQTTQETTQETVTEDFKYIWQETLVHLKEEISPSNFRTWLAETAPTSFDGTIFLVSAQNEFVAKYLNNNMSTLIEKVLTGIVGRQVKFECRVER